ncbi:MAG: helix-turn-helix domain-containing protein, partial [Cyanobacteriota bacterium]|nr:helix-turn-helix domain-containing protein [Cyanobacteriota bacterium]
EILRQQRSVEIAVPQKIAGSQTDASPRAVELAMLVDRLRDLRKQIADTQSVAPYVIFADSTLKLMAQVKPKTVDQLARLSGVTEYKLERYGDRFVSEIRAFLQEQQLPTPLPTSTQLASLQLHQQGLSLEEIAEQRGFKPSTIANHLSEAIEMNQPVEIDRLVEPHLREPIVRAIETVGDSSLKTLRDRLGEAYSYNTIQLVRAWWRKSQNEVC